MRSKDSEEVRLVLDDRAAEAGAELVLAVLALLRRRALLGLGLAVQALVAEVLEDGAPELVGAALGDDLDRAAVGAAGVGAEALGLEVELADGVEREVLHQAADGVVVVVAAVDQVVDVAAAAARHLRRELRRLGGVGVEAEADAGDQRGQVRRTAGR